ncbi:MAG: TonB-dependent receptor [Candidatus Marinimicrobia bacterium]|nr:TonB-dependent receptor [Candidatus Neomarinimicrobiota bacterium]
MRRYLLLVSLTLTMAMGVFAGTSGKITGIVKDAASGKPLPGVNIVLEGTTMGVASDNEGFYTILNVPVGTYDLKAMMIGYTPVITKNVVVSIDLTTKQDFSMQSTVLEAGESVIVTAERPLMRKDEFTSRHTVTAEEMTGQPIDNFQQIAQNQAGTVGSHFRGGRVGEVLVVIDGLPVKDPAGEYSGNMGGFTADVPEAAIQEMEVTLGGFSAEYGNVQSGVLNLALKEGSQKLSGKARFMSTNFGSGLNDLLMGERGDWLGVTYLHKLENNYQFSLNGPLFTKKANFSASAEITDRNQGNFINEQYNNQSYQGKVTIKPTSKTKLSIGGLYSKKDWDEFYLPASKYGPGEDYQANEYWCEQSTGSDTALHYIYVNDPQKYWSQNGQSTIDTLVLQEGDTTHFTKTYYVGSMQDYLWNYHQNSRNLYLVWTQSLSSRTYYELRWQSYYSNYHYATQDVDDRDGDNNTEEDLVWDDTKDGPHPIYRDQENNYWWIVGDDPGYRDQKSWTNTIKGDFVSQATYNHLIKAGFEFDYSRMSVENISWTLGYGTFREDIWDKNTIDFGLYAQDKIEFQGIIALIGLRFDYFDPNGGGDGVNYPADYNNPYSELDTSGLPILINPKKPSAKSQFSPRIAISHPITERDVIHFSYGHYFQRPDAYYLYRNMYFQALTKVGNYVGNPNIDPEKTVAYEIGVEHLFSDDIKGSITGYYKDVTNLMNWYKYIGENLQGIEINVYGNADYGNMKGLEFALTKRIGKFWGGSLNYTFSVAKGRSSTSSSGAGAFSDSRRLNYLSFDQTHTLNANLTLCTPKDEIFGLRFYNYKPFTNWHANFQFKYGSGLPYSSYGTGKVNDKRLPATFNTDLRLSKQVAVAGADVNVFLDVFNLFNRLNVDWIGSSMYYGQTGDPTIVLDETLVGGGLVYNPQAYSDRRQYRFGVEVQF